MSEQQSNKKIGIYKITNIISNKTYIESALDIIKRFKQHKYLLNKNKHHSIALQRAWNKYGSENFVFEIIEECHKDDLRIKEKQYIDSLNTFKEGYNMSERTDCPRVPATKESIQKGLETKRKKAEERGYYFSKEVLEKRKIAQNTEEYKNKKRKNIEDRIKKKVYQYDLDGNFIQEFLSTKIAALTLQISEFKIKNCVKGLNKRGGDFIFSYEKHNKVEAYTTKRGSKRDSLGKFTNNGKFR